MTLSTCLRKITDKHKVPREVLSYVIDSIDAPICTPLLFSTWSVFFAGLFYAEAGIIELGYGSAIETFCYIIPYAFYAIVAVIIIPLFGLVPIWGKCEKPMMSKKMGKVYSPESVDLNLNEEDADYINYCNWRTIFSFYCINGCLFPSVYPSQKNDDFSFLRLGYVWFLQYDPHCCHHLFCVCYTERIVDWMQKYCSSFNFLWQS